MVQTAADIQAAQACRVICAVDAHIMHALSMHVMATHVYIHAVHVQPCIKHLISYIGSEVIGKLTQSRTAYYINNCVSQHNYIPIQARLQLVI